MAASGMECTFGEVLQKRKCATQSRTEGVGGTVGVKLAMKCYTEDAPPYFLPVTADETVLSVCGELPDQGTGSDPDMI